ncbi:MAG: leucine-rich repeat domain-containing protein [Oscillospiraceae bacterium]|nr:leucine-rich repeat domain-containing protein [Oscillospiraceae bacterium]
MSNKKKIGIIAAGIALLLAAGCLTMWLLFTFVGGRMISRSEINIDLKEAGLEDVKALLRLSQPEKMDLRDNPLDAEDIDSLTEKFPDCEILWDVPLGVERFDCLSETLAPSAFSQEQAYLYRYFPNLREVDLRATKLTEEGYKVLRDMIPDCRILWNVVLDESLVLENEASSVTIPNAAMTEALLNNAENFTNISHIQVDYTNLSIEHFIGLAKSFPEAKLEYEISIGGSVVPHDAKKLDFSSVTDVDTDALITAMELLPDVTDVELMNDAGESAFSLEDVLKLYDVFPHVKLNYSFEFFGQVISTDMERIVYREVEIGDEGLAEFRKILPMMHGLTYLMLDTCGTSDEETAKLREDFADRLKVVWKVKVGVVGLYTDTLRIWINDGFFPSQLYKLQYCNEVRYMDVGHMMAVNSLEFARSMPDLEVLIVALTAVTDISPLADCKKLEFLEIFSNDIKDISPLAELQSLQYLNISNLPITDITPIFGLNNLKLVNCNMIKDVLDEQVAQFRELHPDTVINCKWWKDPTGTEWRYVNDDEEGKPTERYQLLCRQIGYNGYAKQPGYITEPVT